MSSRNEFCNGSFSSASSVCCVQPQNTDQERPAVLSTVPLTRLPKRPPRMYSCSIVQYMYTVSKVQYSAVQYNTLSVQHSTTQCNTAHAQHSTAQYSTVQHSTVQHSTARYRTPPKQRLLAHARKVKYVCVRTCPLYSRRLLLVGAALPW